jgi:hypothetical protein
VRILGRDGSEGATAWVESSDERAAAPCDFQLAPGWTRVFYEDDEIALWSHEVYVEEGGTTLVQVRPPPSEHFAFLNVQSLHREEGQGFVPTDGDSIFLDGELLGTTPWEGDIVPGWHSLRVASEDGLDVVEVFSISEGQSRYFKPRLGLQAFSSFRHTSPGRVLLRGPILLSVQVQAPENEAVQQPRLHIISSTEATMDIPLAPVDPVRGVFVGAVDPRHAAVGQSLRYYFSCLTEGGTPSMSEIYSLTPVNELSDRMTP